MAEGRNVHESGDDGRSRFDEKQFQAGLGGTQSDPNGTKIKSGWLADPDQALGKGADQGKGEKKQTGRRIGDALGGKGKERG
ncbi:hypothetical protein ACWGID_11750 [Kribbella sp. NPDC054772]